MIIYIVVCTLPIRADECLSPDEEAWLDAHPTIKVGYFAHYLPLSGTDENGQAIGALVDVIPEILSQAGIKNRVNIRYIEFEDQYAACSALEHEVIDIMFPAYINDDLRQKYNIASSTTLISLINDLAFRGTYDASKTQRLGVNRHNTMQYFATHDCFPHAQIIYYDSIDECLDGIIRGTCDSTLLNSLRTAHLLNSKQYRKIFTVKIPTNIDLCVAFRQGDNGLNKLITKGISSLPDGFTFTSSYNYVKYIDEYTAYDMLLDHFTLVIGTALLIIILLLIIIAVVKRSARREKAALIVARDNQQLINEMQVSNAIYNIIQAARWQWEYNNDGQVTNLVWSHKFRQMLGFEDENDFPNTLDSWFSRIVPEDKAKVKTQLDAFNDIHQQQVKYDVEYRLQLKSGQIHWFHAIGCRLLNKDGSSRLAIGVFLDITDRKSAESQKQLIESLSAEYSTLWHIDTDKNTAQLIKINQHNTETAQIVRSTETPSFEGRMDRYINTFVEEGYREKMRRELSLESLLKNVKGNETFHLDYIQLGSYGEKCYKQICIGRANDDDGNVYLSCGFRDVDNLVRDKHKRYTVQNEAVSVIIEEDNPHRAINRILQIVGSYYKADRAYVIEADSASNTLNNTYEWCREGIKAEIANLQELPYDMLEPWLNSFQKDYSLVIKDIEDLNGNVSPELYQLLKTQNIKSLIAVPLRLDGHYMGLVGVDNPGQDLDAPDISYASEVLRGATSLIQSEIVNRNQNDEEHLMLQKIAEHFISAYYIKPDSDYMRSYRISEEYQHLYGKVSSYTERMKSYLNCMVSEKDRNRLSWLSDPLQVKQKLLESKGVFRVSFTHVKPDGELSVEATFLAVDSECSAFVLYSIDRSEAVKEELKLQRMTQTVADAEAANRAKSTFLFNMSHDIRTPLNAIIGFTDLAERHSDDLLKITEYRQKIKTASMQLLEIINDILDMARIESGKTAIHEELTECEQVVRKCCVVFEHQIKSKKITFSIHNELTHPYLYLDQMHLGEIYLNLLSNAFKYTKEGGRIQMTIREHPCNEEGFCLVESCVEDDGIGMSEEFQKHLFEDFARERTKDTANINGTGLGLPIVKKLVDLMNGTITINSQPGLGSKFTICLRHKIGTAPDNQQASEGPDISNCLGKHILLAEDNELNAEIAIDILENAGLTVERATDGLDCCHKLECANPGTYDLILMDLQMPNLNGYEATEHIRKMTDPIKAKIPIVALTANAFKEDADRALAVGMNGHLAKPIDIKKLITKLAELL